MITLFWYLLGWRKLEKHLYFGDNQNQYSSPYCGWQTITIWIKYYDIENRKRFGKVELGQDCLFNYCSGPQFTNYYGPGWNHNGGWG